jgi:hypothetical protein
MLVPLLFAITPTEALALAEPAISTSGTVGQTRFTTQQLLDHAFRRCGKQPSTVSAENLETATNLLRMTMDTLASRGIAMWCIEKQLVGINEGVSAARCAEGTIDVLDVSLRTATRIEATAANNALASLPDVVDADIETSTDLGLLGDAITLTFDETQVTTIGIMPGVAATWDMTVECYQLGGWVTVADATVEVNDFEWVWIPVEGVTRATQLRVTVAAGASFIVREVYAGSTTRDIPLSKLNRTDYSRLVSTSALGRPVQYWLDKRRTQAYLTLWPAPSADMTFEHLVVYSQRHVQDVGALYQIIEVPPRWFLAIVSLVAKELALELPEVEPGVFERCSLEADRRLAEAWSGETDSSNVRIRVNLRGYT